MAERGSLRRRTKKSRQDGNGQARAPEKSQQPEGAGFNLELVTEFAVILSLVFGGCCTNVWAFEYLLKQSANIGSTITFCQMLFVTLTTLPKFLIWPPQKGGGTSLLPVLKPRQVPLQSWTSQVLVLTTGSLLNNWAFAYDVPLTLQIIFRSSGLPVSMLFGLFFLRRRYSMAQIFSVALVTVGVVLATLSRPSSGAHESASPEGSQYFVGIGMLTVSLVLTGILGLLQERTYKTYGPCWQEGLFYTHLLSLPMFAVFWRDVRQGFKMLNASAGHQRLPLPYIFLAINLVTQLVCVTGVNKLTSRVTSVSTNLALTARKALSLCLSVWLFGNGWNTELAIGASMVFCGSLLYTLVSSR